MAKDYTTQPYAEVRRRDRAVDDELWIRALLHRAPTATLATVYNGQPFINSNLFVYDESRHTIYTHTAQVGRTRANIEAGGQICLSVHEMGRLLPADTALEFSVEYNGVVVFGRAAVVEDEEEAHYGLQLLLDKYFPHLKPGEHYRPIVKEELERTSVFRITIEQWSGKRKKVADDFPGAFVYGEYGSLGTD
jgi:hypothetical protein